MVNSFQNMNINPRSMMSGTSVILNIYLLTIGSMILGFSLYVGLETLERTTRKYVNWTGEGMLWLFVLLFISIFILFIPSDLLKLKYQIKIDTFTNLIGYVVFTIANSIFFIFFHHIIQLRIHKLFIFNFISTRIPREPIPYLTYKDMKITVGCL